MAYYEQFIPSFAHLPSCSNILAQGGNFHFSAGRDQTVDRIVAKVRRISTGAFSAYLAICSLLGPLTLSVKIRSVLAERAVF